MNLNCPFCGGQTMIIETRGNSKVIIRRRKCLECDRQSYTEEKTILDLDSGKDRLQRLRYESYPYLKKRRKVNRNEKEDLRVAYQSRA